MTADLTPATEAPDPAECQRFYLDPARLDDLNYLLEHYGQASAAFQVDDTQFSSDRQDFVGDRIHDLLSNYTRAGYVLLQEAKGQLAEAREQVAQLTTQRDQARAVLRDVNQWIERVGLFVEGVIIIAEDKRPGLELLAELALWNDRRKALLVGEVEICPTHGCHRVMCECLPPRVEASSQPLDATWRDYTIEQADHHPDGTLVLCRSDDMCDEAILSAVRTYLTLGEAVDWAKAHVADHARQRAEDDEASGTTAGGDGRG